MFSAFDPISYHQTPAFPPEESVVDWRKIIYIRRAVALRNNIAFGAIETVQECTQAIREAGYSMLGLAEMKHLHSLCQNTATMPRRLRFILQKKLEMPILVFKNSDSIQDTQSLPAFAALPNWEPVTVHPGAFLCSYRFLFPVLRPVV